MPRPETPDDEPSARLFRALGDPTRRALFERLGREGELTVIALTSRSGVSQPAVSKHLKILKDAGLIRDEKRGRESHYQINPRALEPLADWLSIHRAFWSDHMDRLEGLLKRMDQ